MSVKSLVKNNRIVSFLFLVIFLVAGTFLMWDHKKYGAKEPPSKVKLGRNISVIVICIQLVLMILLASWMVYTAHSDKKTGIANTLLTICVILWIASAAFYAYYYVALRKQYDTKKMPKYLNGLVTTAGWTTVVGFLVLLILSCLVDSNACLLMMLVAMN